MHMQLATCLPFSRLLDAIVAEGASLIDRRALARELVEIDQKVPLIVQVALVTKRLPDYLMNTAPRVCGITAGAASNPRGPAVSNVAECRPGRRPMQEDRDLALIS
jgi:hypothetical protein